MWDLTVLIPDYFLSFYLVTETHTHIYIYAAQKITYCPERG